MTFALDRYEPVAFHLHPELMRAAEAQTAVLHPAGTSPLSPPGPELAPGPVGPAPAALPPVALTESGAAAAASPVAPSPNATATTAVPPAVASAGAPASGTRPVESVPSVLPPPTAAPAAAPTEPIAVYLVGMNTTALLRAGLADFLDAAGSRRDVRVSVGLATGRQVAWALRDQRPYAVRAMPRYPEPGPAADPAAALAATAAAVTVDAAGHAHRRQLVVLVWDRWPDPVAPPVGLRSALVLHCVDAVLTPPAGNGAGSSAWILARTRSGPTPSLLAHTGRLLDRWEAFGAVPPGLVLAPSAAAGP